MKKIIVKNDNEAELNVFVNFMNSKRFPQHRVITFMSYPDLEERIKSSKDSEKNVVKQFIKEVRDEHSDNLQKAYNYIKKEVEKNGEKTVEILSKLMDYEWKEDNDDYYLVPTIYPTCPFWKNTFYFSIYKTTKGFTEYPKVLAVSAHEISHMMFFDILEDNKIKLSQDMMYFIKELIAPILVYQDDFSEIFEKNIIGNLNVLEIFFDINKKNIKAFDYFLEMFEKNREKGGSFLEFIKKMILICKTVED